MSRLTSGIDAHDFDEEAGKTISANTCPICTGEVRTDGGQIDCLACGTVLNDYAWAGRVPGLHHTDHVDRTPGEAV